MKETEIRFDNPHGFAVGDQVRITGVQGIVELNGHVFTVGSVTEHTITPKEWRKAGKRVAKMMRRFFKP